MRVYRIASAAHATDLSGTGGRLYNGRWHHAGNPVVYTAEHPALAAWELLVHTGVPVTGAPLNHHLIEIGLPQESVTAMEEIPSLPHDPRAVGSAWLRACSTLLLRVPSVVVPLSRNILINPRHPEARELRAEDRGIFVFDQRVRSA